MGKSFFKLVLFIALAILSLHMGVNLQIYEFWTVSAICISIGIILWKLDKIERLLKENEIDL